MGDLTGPCLHHAGMGLYAQGLVARMAPHLISESGCPKLPVDDNKSDDVSQELNRADVIEDVIYSVNKEWCSKIYHPFPEKVARVTERVYGGDPDC